MHQSISKKIRIYLYILLFLFLSSINNFKLNQLSNDFFNLKTITILGLDERLKKNIQLKFNILRNQNLLFLDKENFLKIFNTIDYIDNYKISKIYPSEIRIIINKTDFIAITFIDGKKFLVGENGNFILEGNHIYKKELPVVYGKYEIYELMELVDLLKKINFESKDIKELYFFETRRWDLLTKNNILIKLPSSNLENSLNIAQELLNKKKGKKIIDLRVSNQVIITNE